MKILLVFFGLVSSITCFTQDYLKSEDEILKQKYIRVVNRNAGVAIQKIIYGDSNIVKFELGLFIDRLTVMDDNFLNHSNYIVFSDGTSIVFEEKVEMSFYSAGKNNIYLLHILSGDELKSLQTKKIEYFKLLGYKRIPDKWEKDKLLKTFMEIEDRE